MAILNPPLIERVANEWLFSEKVQSPGQSQLDNLCRRKIFMGGEISKGGIFGQESLPCPVSTCSSKSSLALLSL